MRYSLNSVLVNKMIVDTHCHLNDEELYPIREELIKDAINNGVKKIVVVGYDVKSSKKAIDICKEYPNICYALVGIHPSNISDNVDIDLKEIEELLKEKCVIGIGEIGLDYHYEPFDSIVQKDIFIKQIKLADKYNLPIIIHTRDAMGDTIDILKDNSKYIRNNGIMHCYSGSSEIAKECIKLGFYISYGGPLTFTNNKVSKEVIKTIPKEYLLFETDAPYLSPHPLRGTTNKPSNIRYVINEASKLLNIDCNELIDIEYENFMRLFKL